MFGKKKEICCICNQNIGEKKIADGVICKNCISDSKNFLLAFTWRHVTSEQVQQAIKINKQNQEYLNIFHSTNKFEKYIDIDENNKLWKIPCFSPSIVFSYNDIISYELLQNGESITKGGIGSAMMGGALLGGVGAIVGANVGSKRTIHEISEYRIKIVTKNLCLPEIYINFLVTGKIKTNSLLYKAYTANAQRVLSLLANIVDSASNATPSPPSSIPEEIMKYKKLLDDGIITQEEFEVQKAKLLNL